MTNIRLGKDAQAKSKGYAIAMAFLENYIYFYLSLQTRRDDLWVKVNTLGNVPTTRVTQ